MACPSSQFRLHGAPESVSLAIPLDMPFIFIRLRFLWDEHQRNMVVLATAGWEHDLDDSLHVSRILVLQHIPLELSTVNPLPHNILEYLRSTGGREERVILNNALSLASRPTWLRTSWCVLGRWMVRLWKSFSSFRICCPLTQFSWFKCKVGRCCGYLYVLLWGPVTFLGPTATLTCTQSTAICLNWKLLSSTSKAKSLYFNVSVLSKYACGCGEGQALQSH